MDLSQIIGVVGGGIGCVAGVLALWDRWRHRQPKLRLSVPVSFGVRKDGRDIHCLLLRIANDSRSAANLYLNTIRASVRSGGSWHEVALQIASFAGQRGAGRGLFDDRTRLISGVEDVPGLKLYEEAKIEYDSPLTRYVALDMAGIRLPGPPDAVKFVIEDCHGRKLTLQADLSPGR